MQTVSKEKKSKKLPVGKIALLAAVALIAALMLCYIGYQIYQWTTSGITTEMAQYVTVRDTETLSGTVVRQEELITSDADGVIAYALQDGERVKKDGVIAYLYDSEQEAQAQKRMETLQEEVEQLQQIESGSFGQALQADKLDEQITEKLRTLGDYCDEGSFTDLEELKTNLTGLLNKRQLVTGVVTDFSARISQLNSEIDSLKAQYPEQPESIVTGQSGYFYSRADGYENLISVEDVKDLSVQQVDDLLAQEPSEVADNVIGKVAINHEWYYLCTISSQRAEKMYRGGSYKLSVPFLTTEEIPVTAQSIGKDEEGRTVLLLRSSYVTGEIASLRRQKVDLILNSYEGLKVPNDAVRIVDGVKGVYIQSGGQAMFVRINPIYYGDSYVISSTADDGETDLPRLLQLYDEIIVEGKDLYDGKVLK